MPNRFNEEVKFSAGVANAISREAADLAIARFKNSKLYHSDLLHKHMADRLGQEVANLVNKKLQMMAQFKSEQFPLLTFKSPEIEIRPNLNINLVNGEMDVRFSLWWCRSFLRYLVRWLLAVLATAAPTSRLLLPADKTCLVYGLPSELCIRGDDGTKFQRYLQCNPITPLKTTDHLIIENVGKVRFGKKSLYRFPENFYLRHAKLSSSQRRALFLGQILGLYRTLKLLFQHPIIILFIEDFGVLWSYLRLSTMGCFPTVLLTTSNLYLQPIWARLAGMSSLNCLHYAVVPQVIVERGEPFQKDAEVLPHMNFLADMHHWVWFRSDRDKLDKLYGQKLVSISGVPSFLVGKGSVSRLQKERFLDVVIFDVTPFREDVAYAEEKYYYGRLSTAIGLIRDACDACERVRRRLEIDCRISLKQKRVPTSKHSVDYEFFLVDMERKNSSFKRISCNATISDILTQETLVVARPFTSAGFLSASLGVNTVFYDPTCEIVKNCPEVDNLFFAQGVDQLIEKIDWHVRKTRMRLK